MSECPKHKNLLFKPVALYVLAKSSFYPLCLLENKSELRYLYYYSSVSFLHLSDVHAYACVESFHFLIIMPFAFIQENTFQAVVATDGSATYVMFLYEDMQWATVNTTIGFNAGDGIRSNNLNISVELEDLLDLESRSNVGPDYPGMFLFRVDQSTIIGNSVSTAG